MNGILEEFYLTRLEFIDQMRENRGFRAAAIEYDAALARLKGSIGEDQQLLLRRLEDARASLEDQAAASAFAAGYRFRMLLTGACLE